MAKVIENKKGFKVIEISKEELLKKLSQYGCIGICDFCGKPTEVGYYVAVINQWLCQDCYQDFISKVSYCIDDKPIEDRNFKFYSKLFGI
jgi:hypothetical protein